MKGSRLAGLALVCSTLASASTLAADRETAQVPVVGCASDGQVGPIDPPTTLSPGPSVPLVLQGRLAYYEADNMGVLGPVGWHCFRIYGSSGEDLFVTPDAHGSEFFIGATQSSLAGPAIQLGFSYGGTSGRFEVAAVVARVFPVAKKFVQDVIAEGLEPKVDFPSEPYPDDELARLSDTEVEFITPPNKEGLGTQGWLKKNGMPISGVLILSTDEENDLTRLNVRLATDMRDLAPAIIHQVEGK